MDKQLVISTKTIIITLLIIFGGYVIYRMGSVIGILLLAVLVVIAMEPLVKKISRVVVFNKPIPRGPAVTIAYLLLVLVMIVVITVGLPPVIAQIQKLFSSLGSMTSRIEFGGKMGFSLSDLIPQVSKLSGDVLSITVTLVKNITAVISLLVLSIYLSLDWENIKKQLISLMPEEKGELFKNIMSEIENSVAQWVKGQLFLMLVIGLVSFVGLEILQVKYSLGLGIVSGFLEVVPILGPVLSAVLAAIVAFSDTPIKGLAVLILFAIIQRLENDLLVPKVMQKVSGFSPFIVLVALLIGSTLFGVIGAIVAIPFTIIAVIIVKRVLNTGSS